MTRSSKGTFSSIFKFPQREATEIFAGHLNTAYHVRLPRRQASAVGSSAAYVLSHVPQLISVQSMRNFSEPPVTGREAPTA